VQQLLIAAALSLIVGACTLPADRDVRAYNVCLARHAGDALVCEGPKQSYEIDASDIPPARQQLIPVGIGEPEFRGQRVPRLRERAFFIVPCGSQQREHQRLEVRYAHLIRRLSYYQKVRKPVRFRVRTSDVRNPTKETPPSPGYMLSELIGHWPERKTGRFYRPPPLRGSTVAMAPQGPGSCGC
jgi:hypothetical protein